MRKWVPLVLTIALVPALATTLSAQSTGPSEDRLPKAARTITEAQARSTALAHVRAALAAGKLKAWGGGTGGGIRASTLTVAGAVWRAKDAKAPAGGGGPTLPSGAERAKDAKDPASGDLVPGSRWFVGVTAPNAQGHVRVELDARTGAVIDAKVIEAAGWDAAKVK